jgi:SRSO17 transposase
MRTRVVQAPVSDKAMRQRDPILAWIVDETGCYRKGGIRWEWRGRIAPQLSEQDNCQVGMSLSVATREASLPVTWRLYLPEEWAREGERRRAGVPEQIQFETKPEIALDLIRRAVEEEVAVGAVLADAG